MLTLLLNPALFLTTFLAVDCMIAAESVHHVNKRAVACYDILGCFNSDGPFGERALSLAPESPFFINTQYYLYTRENPSVKETLAALQLDSIESTWSKLQKRSTKIIVHGFLTNPSLGMTWMDDMKDELLIYGDYNVILVDWSGGNLPPYTQATANTRVVGAQVGELIKSIVGILDLSFSDFHIMGHSLGAHISGYAGERLEGGLGRISGLDPAGLYFEGTQPVVRLDSTDAILVDNIHTDGESVLALGFGTAQAMGHMDFYPNGGSDQPGCERDPSSLIKLIIEIGFSAAGEDFVACNHHRAIRMFTESINSECQFKGYPCSNFVDFQSYACDECPPEGCAPMGFHADMARPVSGAFTTYYLKTAESAPFCVPEVNKTALTQSKVLLVVQLELDDNQEERGGITLNIRGGLGSTGDLSVDEDPFYLYPGDTYKFIVKWSNTDIGQILSVDFTWVHSSSIFDFSGWNPFGLRTPKINAAAIDVYRMESGELVHLCARGQEIENEETVTIDNRCTEGDK